MQPRISMITLGVRDLIRSAAFYEQGLSLPRLSFPSDDVVFFTLNGTWLGLYGWSSLAKDAGLPAPHDQGISSYKGTALAHNLTTPAAVDELYTQAIKAGATPTKPPQEAFWGGYSGYFKDPDGHLWELAHNPFMWVGPKDETPENRTPENKTPENKT